MKFNFYRLLTNSVIQYFMIIAVISVLICFVNSEDDDSQISEGDHCFCKLKGQIGDCSCSVDTVDYFNNAKVYPRLQSLISRDYFRFYKVNLNKKCPFWSDDSRCAMKFCNVKPCSENDIPIGLKGRHHDDEDMSFKYLAKSQQTDDCDPDNDELGYLNTTISAAAYEEFAIWKAYDDALDNFCTLPDEDEEAQYVDLSLNPERYTGYRGPSAHRIWRSIYMENCFKPTESFAGLIGSAHLTGMCLEKRVFYRVISGLHTSINIHLTANYLFREVPEGLVLRGPEWGPNLKEFRLRFSPETTVGEGPAWLRNLYFLYLLELRAVAKAAPYLLHELYYTGNKEEDRDTKAAIKDFLSVIGSFEDHFNENTMFSGGNYQAAKLKEEFKQHFRNISRIMDCVGCEKCKLWGKLQVQGLGTALKILFSGKFDKMDNESLLYGGRRLFNLKRSEIVALFNALARLSSSIFHIDVFRQMMR